ncbi:hypothetical protein ACQ4PT_072178 [Festuca glaucescens]
MMPRRFLNLVMMDLRVSGSYWLSRMKPEEDLFYSSTPPRVVVADSAGHALLYDADDGSAEILPPINEAGESLSRISLRVTNPKRAVRPDALYTINWSSSANFKSLVYCNAADVMAWRWLDLPEPPYFYDVKEDRTIHSHTLLGDGKTICFSGGFGTYCFDTDSQEWTKAGSWTLPFSGRALRVPELCNLYFGFHGSNTENLIAVELDGGDARPKVLHRWRGFCPPHQNEWSLRKSSLLYLGNYRFCIAKWYVIYEYTMGLPLKRTAFSTW